MHINLTESDQLKLRAFQRQVNRLRRGSIAQKYFYSKITIDLDSRTGQITASYSGYEPEAFQSQLPIFRQFILQGEPVNFYHICNIIEKECGRSELRSWERHARLKWKQILDETPDPMFKLVHEATVTVDEALERLFYGYGGLFHVKVEAPEEEELVAVIEQSLLQEAFPKLCWCLSTIDIVINLWLDAPQEAVPQVPAS